MIRLPPSVAAAVALLRAEAEAIAAATRGFDDADWARTLETLDAHLVTPQAHAACAAAGLLPRLPADVVVYLDRLAALNARRNRAMAAQLDEALAALATAGIRPVLLKGGVALLHPEPPARVMYDVDLLVRQDQVETTLGLLRDLGYTNELGYDHDAHAVLNLARPGAPMMFDVHKRVMQPDRMLTADEVFSRAVPSACGRALLPGPDDAAWHVLVHEAVHHHAFLLGQVSLKASLDMAKVLPAADAAELAARVRRHGLLGAAGGVVRLADALFGPMPAPILAACGAQRPIARLHAWRVAANARKALPRVVDVVLRQAIKRLSASRRDASTTHLPLPLWRLRQAWAGLRAAPAWWRRGGKDDPL